MPSTKYCPNLLCEVGYETCEHCNNRTCVLKSTGRARRVRCERCGKIVGENYKNHLYAFTEGTLNGRGFGYVEKNCKMQGYIGLSKPYGFYDYFLCDVCKKEFMQFLHDEGVNQYPDIKVGSKKYNTIIVALDQSYKNTGVCIICDGEIKHVTSWQTKAKHRDSKMQNTIYRRMFAYWLDNLLTALEKILVATYSTENLTEEEHKKNKNRVAEQRPAKLEEPKIYVCFERIRTFSQGHLSTKYLINTGALVSVIIDVASRHRASCHSVDTRAWKATFCGTSKPSEVTKYNVPKEKWPTVRECLNLGLQRYIVKIYDEKPRKTKGIFKTKKGKFAEIDNDACDAVGIGFCALHAPQKFICESESGKNLIL